MRSTSPRRIPRPALPLFWALTVAGAFAIASSSPGGAADWPQWRGPARDGAAPDAAFPSPLPEKLRQVWRVQVGEGHSSPVVAGDRVFVHSREGDDEVVRALDLATGRELWRHADPTAYTMNPAAIQHGKGPKSTPVVAGGTVCTLGIAGRLSCFEAASGRVLWQNDWKGRFAETAPDFGTAMSPAIVAGKLIAHVGGVGAGALAAFDLATGKEIWRWEGEGPGYASPVLATFDGVEQIVTQTREHVVAVAADGGRELWKVELKTPYVQNIATPLVYRDTVIVSGLYNPVRALRPRLAGDRRGFTIEEVWRNADVDLYMSSPVLVSGQLVGFTSKRSGQLFALDPATGKTLWLGDPRQGDQAALIAAGDQLVVQNVAGELAIGPVDASGWKPSKRYTVANSATWAHPALLGKRLLVKDATQLTLWSFE
jgi:outer membrane protein assembly factor BamB